MPGEFTIELDGTVLPGARLLSFVARHELLGHSFLSAELRDEELALIGEDDLLGRRIVITHRGHGDSAQVFDGLVNEVSTSFGRAGRRRTAIEACGWTRSLTETTAPRTFERASVRDILETVLSANGLSLEFNAPDRAIPWTVHQYGESDYDFIMRILDESELFLIGTGKKLIVQNGFTDAGLVSLDLGKFGSLEEFGLTSRTRNHVVEGHFHDTSQDHTSQVRRKKDESGRSARPEAALAQKASCRHAPRPRRMDFGGRISSGADLDARIARESRRQLRHLLGGHGVTTEASLRPGRKVEIIGAGASDGKYGIVSTEHIYDGRIFTTGFSVTAADRFDLPASPLRTRYSGLASASVVENNDPKRRGRIKVRYRWQEEGESSYWARSASIYSGAKRGIHFLPEIGDEVIVGFVDGDHEQPVILGTVWNGKANTPEKTEASNDTKIIRTRSGCEVIIRDRDKEELIELHTPKEECVVRLANGKKPAIFVLANSDVTVTAKQGNIDATAGNNVSVRAANGDVSVEASKGNIKLRAPLGELAVEAKSVSITSQTSLAVRARDAALDSTSGKAALTSMQIESSTADVRASSVLTLRGLPVKIN